MKRSRFFVRLTLFALLIITLSGMSIWLLLPPIVEHRLSHLISSYGVRAQVKLSDLSLRGVRVQVTVEDPVRTALPMIEVERVGWSGFRVFFPRGQSRLRLVWSGLELEVLPEQLEFRGYWDLRSSRLIMEQAEVGVATYKPLLGNLRVRFNGDLAQPGGSFAYQLKPQKLGSVFVRSDVNLCWNIRADSALESFNLVPCDKEVAFSLELPKIPVFRAKWVSREVSWANSRGQTSGNLRFSNEGAKGQISYQVEKGPKALELGLKSSVHLGTSSIRRTLKRLNVKETDLRNSDFNVSIQARLPLSKATKSLLSQQITAKASADVEIPEGTAHSLALRGLRLRASLICDGSLDAMSSPQRICKLDPDAQPLILEAERIGKTQPFRDFKLVLGEKVESLFSANWQGAILQSKIKEFEMKNLVVSSGVLDLQVKGIALYEVFRLIDRPDLRGKGTLEGNALIRWNTQNGLSAGLWVNPARLGAVGPGVIQYGVAKSSEPIDTLKEFQGLLAQGQQALVMKALEDFQFKKLEASFFRSPTSLSKIELKLSGKNPSLARGQPFEISMPIEGNLESLIIDSLMRDFENP